LVIPYDAGLKTEALPHDMHAASIRGSRVPPITLSRSAPNMLAQLSNHIFFGDPAVHTAQNSGSKSFETGLAKFALILHLQSEQLR
jgi:hypothetical protein